MLSRIPIRLGMGLMALMRATEAYQPERERLFDDPVSIKFVPPVLRLYLLPGLRQAAVRLLSRQQFGVYANLLCRTRFIDEALHAAAQAGVEQVVNLGAGFDVRAFRMPGGENVRFFELDLPDTQAAKKQAVVKALGALPPNVVFVPVDFDRDAPADLLAQAGFRSGARTFFIWEGVTQYITPEAVDATLRMVARIAAPGSELAFTYIRQGLIDGSDRSPVEERLFQRMARGPMPWMSGLDPDTLADYLFERGLTLVNQMAAPEYQTHYLQPIKRRMTVFTGEFAALARVAG